VKTDFTAILSAGYKLVFMESKTESHFILCHSVTVPSCIFLPTPKQNGSMYHLVVCVIAYMKIGAYVLLVLVLTFKHSQFSIMA